MTSIRKLDGAGKTQAEADDLIKIKKLRASSPNITREMAEFKPKALTYKFYDKDKCKGLFVAISPTAQPTFYVKAMSAGQRRTIRLGVYHPTDYPIETARVDAHQAKARGGRGINVAQERRNESARLAKQALTMNQLIDLRIKYMETTLVDKGDGLPVPEIESWEAIGGHLDSMIRPRLGKKLACEVTKHDIATLSDDIRFGRNGMAMTRGPKAGQGSVSRARHMRRAASAMFNWAAEAGRDYVTASPCVNLPKLPAEAPRARVLSEAEIRTLWHGLDRDDVRANWDRRTCLALKLELVTMLRSAEVLGIHTDELDLSAPDLPGVDIAARRVKKRRVIQQPLSSLAMEIIREALGNRDGFVFPGRYDETSLDRRSMATALRGNSRTRPNGKVQKIPGICSILGMAKFTPHDLRRTAATLAQDLCFSLARIAPCLDHAVTKDDFGRKIPTVTGRVYARSKALTEKREVLDAVAAELRRIIGQPASAKLSTARPVDRKLITLAA